MKHLILITMLAITSLFYGCDTASTVVGPTTPTDTIDTSKTVAVGQKINITGKLNLADAGKLDPTSILVSVAGFKTNPNADGTYKIEGTLPVVASRIANVSDTVRIIIGSDTLKEIPLISWDSVLPTNYIVQRNIAVQTPVAYAGNKVQAVWWSDDSIARVLTLGKGTSKLKYSGFIYSVYDNDQYINNAHIYSIFVRIRDSKDSIVAYSEITDVRAIVGNLDYDSTQISKVYNYVTYLYTKVPNDSVVTNYMRVVRKALKIDTSYQVESIRKLDNFKNDVMNDSIYISKGGFAYVDSVEFKELTNFKSDDSVNENTKEFQLTFTSDIDVDSVEFRFVTSSSTVEEHILDGDTIQTIHIKNGINTIKLAIGTDKPLTSYQVDFGKLVYKGTPNSHRAFFRENLTSFELKLVYTNIVKRYI